MDARRLPSDGNGVAKPEGAGGPAIAVIGGGASGALFTLHVLRAAGHRRGRIDVFDPSGTLGRGVAYSTPHGEHLLNVPAGRMSAFPDRPDDFVTWLEAAGRPWRHTDFVPRQVYGSYLVERLNEAIEWTRGTIAVEVHPEAVVGLDHGGGRSLIRGDGGTAVWVDAVVLATGLGAPRDPIAGSLGPGADRYVADPWRPDALDAVGADDTVSFVGTGLTTVDAVALLLARGHRGRLHACSRHGLFPRAHDGNPMPAASPDGSTATWNGARSAREIVRQVRAQVEKGEIHGRDWRSVFDELRRQTPVVWSSLAEPERDRLLRLVQRQWDVHRHRIPPGSADVLARAIRTGQLTVAKGRLDKVHVDEGRLLVTLRRGERCGGGWATDWLVNCTGPRYELDFAADPLLHSLAQQGCARPGPHGLGLDTGADGRVLSIEGRAQAWLWAMGALRRGNLYETTAVAELREQAASIADQVLAATTAPHVRVPTRAARSTAPQVIVIDVADVGNRSYIVHDGDVGIVIDPPTDVERVVAEADRRGLTISHVLETHIHNDYVSGGLTLSRRCDAVYGVAAGEPVAFGPYRRGLRHGDTVVGGGLRVTVRHTPGHTPHHLSYLASTGQGPAAWFSGGSLLYDTTGRTDLYDPDATDVLARAQWRSLNEQVKQLPPETLLYPTHGFGSFCAAGAAGSGTGPVTLGEQLQRNLVLTRDEDTFVSEVRRNRGPFPRYYAHMGPLNRQVSEHHFPALLRRCARHDPEGGSASTVIDLRERRSFAASHWPGSVNVEAGDALAAFIGWTIPWGSPVTLVSDDWATVEKAAGALARIGIEEVHGALYAPSAESVSYRVAGFGDLKAALSHRSSLVVLDAREHAESALGKVEGSVLLPFHCVDAAIDVLDPDAEIWVHCARGYRAAIAASLLHRRGLHPVLVDDTFNHAREVGIVCPSRG
jgi:hydroxyacylglutathione hydrolase